MVIVEDYLQYLEFKELYDKTIYEMQFITEGDDRKNFQIFQKIVDYSKKGLKSLNFDPSFIKQFSTKMTKNIESSFNRGIPAEKAANQMLKDFFTQIKNKVMAMSVGEKVVLGIVVFTIILILNTFILQAGVSMLMKFGLAAEQAVGLMIPIVGPLFEEAAKNLFIQWKMPWLGTGVTFGAEVLLYLYKFWKNGKLALNIVIGRLIGLAMHFFTTKVQKGYMEEHPDKAFTAYLIGFMVHFAWNAMPAAVLIAGGASLQDAGLA